MASKWLFYVSGIPQNIFLNSRSTSPPMEHSISTIFCELTVTKNISLANIVSKMKIFEKNWLRYNGTALYVIWKEMNSWITSFITPLHHGVPYPYARKRHACHDSSLFPLTLHPNLFPISLCLALLGSCKLISPWICGQRKSRRCFKNIFLHLNINRNSILCNTFYVV